MIFKSLFRPKYQSHDPKVRIQAIASLSPQDAQQKTLLHELAFNDSDPKVSLAALTKLDNFTLWYKMAEIAKDVRVAKKAQQIVEKVLLEEQQDYITETEKRTFILECRNTVLLEKLVTLSRLQNSDPELILSLLKRLDKPYLYKQIFFATSSSELQLALLSFFDSENELNKIIKKIPSGPVFEAAQHKLSELLFKKQKPIEVDKQTRLVLSRLLALKDQQDYQAIAQKRDALDAEFIALQADFDCLNMAKIEEFTGKFSEVNNKIFARLETLKPQWQHQQAQHQQEQQVEAVSIAAKQCLSSVNEQLANDIAGLNAQQIEQLRALVQQHLQQVQSLTSQLKVVDSNTSRKLESMYQQLLGCLTTIDKLPAFQQAIEKAQTLLQDFISLPTPTERIQIDAASAHLYELKAQWNELKHPFASNWPAELSQQWNQAYKIWQGAIKTLGQSVQQDVSRCRNKMRALDNLIEQGKFRLAIGLYAKVNVWYQALPEKQRQQLARAFEKAQQQVENLKDWQAYIAQPRKPTLLAEAESLAQSPVDIERQAQQVKDLRSEWNSLGKLATEADDALNLAFDKAIEVAFAPCRDFYAQQQQQREMNLLAKQTVLTKLSALNQPGIEAVELAKQLPEIQQEWQGVGEVDYGQLDELNNGYRAAIAPLKQKIATYQQHNADQKQTLLNKAEKLLELDDLADAAEQAKQLQQQWKTIEHAGRRAEGQLWSAFRKINDQIFAKRKAQYQQVKDIEQQQLTQINAALKNMQDMVEQAQDKSSLSQALAGQGDILEQLRQLPERQRKTADSKLAAIVKLQQQKMDTLQNAQHKQQYVDLFNALESWRQDEVPATVEELPQSWQQYFQLQSKPQAPSRHELTLMMEILAEQESPEQDAETRKALQMQLMAARLQHGEEQNLDDLLKQWIQQGPLSKQDLGLLARVKTVVIA